MYLKSDGSDRKIISQQTDYRRHLPWMNAGLCFILKYILLRQTLFRGIMMFIQKVYFQENRLLLYDYYHA